MKKFTPLALAVLLALPAAHASPSVTIPGWSTPGVDDGLAAGLDMMLINTSLLRNGDNVWQRAREGFQLPEVNPELVRRHEKYYTARPEYLRRTLDRSRKYLFHIMNEVEKRGMPTELALLPMVESAYNPMALSPARASGLWQFIPSTGKNYKLQQNWWQDQRRDIVASTSAALDYLQYIYDMHGDWQLALDSYNWGEGAVKRAIEKNTARGLPTDYSSLTMPAETRHYVPKLQALKNIFNNPRLMAELKLPEILNRPYFATVENSRPIDVTTAARLAGMPLNEFVALNPSHNRPVIKADTPLVLPADKVETFQANLENCEEPLSRWQTYTLKPGEKLDRLAPRFGISLADLKRVNGLQGQLRIAAGSTLLVPAGKGEAALDDAYIQPLPPPQPPQLNTPRLPQIAAQAGGRKGAGSREASKLAATPGKPRPGAKGEERPGKAQAGKLIAKAGAAAPGKMDKSVATRVAATKVAAKVPVARAASAAAKPAAKAVAQAGKDKKTAAKPGSPTPTAVKAAAGRRA